jgi:hypothetical protein
MGLVGQLLSGFGWVNEFGHILPPLGGSNDKSTYQNKMVLKVNSSKSKSFNNYKL